MPLAAGGGWEGADLLAPSGRVRGKVRRPACERLAQAGARRRWDAKPSFHFRIFCSSPEAQL